MPAGARSSASATGSCSKVRIPAAQPSWAMPGAHRAGPHDAERRGRAGHFLARHRSQVIAFTPVTARPMISFWICDVPS